jgi:hypothetical protein
MQPTELRIGNMIFDSECHPHYFKVEQIARHVGYELWVVYRNGSVKCKNPEPIQLTPEILLKVGAEKVEGTQCYKLAVGDIWIIVYPSGSIEIWNDVDTIKLNIDINQLHKFQNLVFALTGTELNVDELLK